MAKVKGVKKLQDRLKRLTRTSKENIAAASLKAANRLVDEMKRAAPVDDGALRDSIKARPGYSRNQKGRLVPTLNETSVAVVAGNKEAFHAPFVEFGTAPHMNSGIYEGTQHPGTVAQPFFYPTWRASQRRTLSAVRRALNKALRGTPEN
jgi:HK97 gp10 family phage protein